MLHSTSLHANARAHSVAHVKSPVRTCAYPRTQGQQRREKVSSQGCRARRRPSISVGAGTSKSRHRRVTEKAPGKVANIGLLPHTISKYSQATRPSIEEAAKPVPLGKQRSARIWYLSTWLHVRSAPEVQPTEKLKFCRHERLQYHSRRNCLTTDTAPTAQSFPRRH